MNISFFIISITLSFFPAPLLYPTTGMQPAASPMDIDITIWNSFITIPTTATGICAYCGREKTGSFAPYVLSIFSTAAMESTTGIWVRKLEKPKESIFFGLVPFDGKGVFI